ncbi:MFS transporter [Pectobacterium brasiliense]|uniref:MFS transporter n=1 Tax=Pectobacterium brasiliense TaxID=180957 RepID=UPI0037F90A25
MNNIFGFFIGSSALSLLGIEVFHITLPLLVLALGFSPIEVSWCIFSFFLPVIIVKVASSTFIEKGSKIKTLKIGEFGRLFIAFSLALILFLSKELNLVFIVSISFFFGVFTVFTEVAEPVVLKSLLNNKQSTSALSTYEIRTRSVQLLAPVLCGFLISINLFTPYLIVGIISIFSLFLLSKIKIQESLSKDKNKIYLKDDVSYAIKWLKNNKLFSLMIMLTSINNLLHPVLYLSVIFSLSEKNAGFEVTGLILSGLGVGGIVGSLMSKKLIDNIPLRTIVLYVNIFRVAIFSGFIIIDSPIGIFSLFVLKAILGGVWNVSYNIFTIKEMPLELAARISAISGTLIKLSAGAGSLGAGYMLSLMGIETTIIVLVIFTLFMLLCSFMYKDEYTRFERECLK